MKNNRFSQKRNPHHLMPSQHSQHSQQQGSPTSSIPPQKHVNVIHNIVYHTTGPLPPMMDHAQHYSQPGYYYAPPYMTDAMLGKMAPMSSSPPLIQHYTSDPAFLEYPIGQYSHGLSQIGDVSQPSMMMSSPLDEYDEDLDEEYMYDQPPTPAVKNRNSGELRYVHGHHLGHHQQQQQSPPPPPPPQQQQQSELLPPHQHHRVHHPHQFPQLQPYHLQHRGQTRHANTPTYQTYHQKYQYPPVPPEIPLDHQYRIPYPSNHQHHRQRQQTTLASASSPPPPPPPQQHHRYRIPQYQQQQRPMYYKSPNVVMSPDETMPYAPGEYDEEYDSPQDEYQQDDSVVLEDIFDGDPIFGEFDYNDEDTYFNQQIPNTDGYGEPVDMEMTTSTPHTQYPTNQRTNNKRTTTTTTKPPVIQRSQSRPVPKPNKKVQQPITKMLKKANSSNQLRPKSAKSTPASTPSSIPAPTVRQQKQMATKAKNTYIDDRRLPFDDSAQTMGSNNNKKVAKPAKKPPSSAAAPPKNSASADNYRKYSFVFEACSNIRKKNPPSSTASTPAGLQSAGAMITPATETTTPATNFTPTTGIEHKKSNSNSSSNSFTVSPVILDNDGFNTFNMVSPR